MRCDKITGKVKLLLFKEGEIMFCSECGSALPDGSKFCQVCGAKQLQVSEEQPANQTEEQEVQIQQENMQQNMQQNPYGQVNSYMQQNPYGQVNPAMQQNPYGQVYPYMQANPYAQPNPYLDPSVNEKYMAIKKEKLAKVLSVFSKIISIIGIMINAVYLLVIVFNSPDFSRMEEGFRSTYNKGVLFSAIALAAVSLITYIILFFVKKTVYTCFYPVITLEISVVIYITTNNYVSAYRDDSLARYGYGGVSGYISGSKSASLFLVLISAFILLLFVLYCFKGAKWPLWVNLILGVGASALGLLALGRISNVVNGFEFTVGNYIGYTLVALVHAYAYASCKDDSKEEKGD